jgi:hypothetical protein
MLLEFVLENRQPLVLHRAREQYTIKEYAIASFRIHLYKYLEIW